MSSSSVSVSGPCVTCVSVTSASDSSHSCVVNLQLSFKTNQNDTASYEFLRIINNNKQETAGLPGEAGEPIVAGMHGQ